VGPHAGRNGTRIKVSQDKLDADRAKAKLKTIKEMMDRREAESKSQHEKMISKLEADREKRKAKSKANREKMRARLTAIRNKTDANKMEMIVRLKAKIEDNNESFKVLQSTLVSRMYLP
jgi:hypothetical protein